MRRRPRSATRFFRRRRYDVVFYTPFVGWMLTHEPSTPPGGAETQILRLAKAIARLGGRVAIVVYGERGKVPKSLEGVRLIRRAQYRGNKPAIAKLIELVRISYSLWRAPSPVVVYRTASLELGMVGIYSKLTRRRMVFSTANRFDFDLAQATPRARDRILYRLGVRLADYIVVQTDEQVELCRSAFGREPVLIRSLADVADAQPADAPEAFLWVGRLVSYKNPAAYLDLARAVPDAKFWMVGVPACDREDDRRLGKEVLREAREIPNLEILAPRPQPEIERLMANAVASVNTSYNEGMPNVLLEAWAQGVPALVLEQDPDSVVTKHGLGAFAAGSSHCLAEHALGLWETRFHRPELQARCREYVAAYHSLETVTSQWLDVLHLASLRRTRQ